MIAKYGENNKKIILKKTEFFCLLVNSGWVGLKPKMAYLRSGPFFKRVLLFCPSPFFEDYIFSQTFLHFGQAFGPG